MIIYILIDMVINMDNNNNINDTFSKKHEVCMACYLILTMKKDILLLNRLGDYDNGKYTLISGHVDKNESVIDAMIREAKEEAGISLNISNLTFVSVVHRHQNQKYGRNNCIDYVDFYFHADKWNNDIVNNEPHKHSEIRWFDIEHLPYLMVSHVESAITNFISDKLMFSVYGWNNINK